MLRATINNRAVRVLSMSLTEPQSKIPTFNVTIPARDVVGIAQLYFEPIQIFDEGRLIVSGIVRTPVALPEIKEGADDPGVISLKCDTELGLLAAEEGALLHLQDELVSTAITQLLATTTQTTWALNDITTLNDLPVTIDLRGKQTIWSQIQEVVKESGTPTYVRYGGQVAGVYQLDIGAFGAQPDSNRVLKGVNVLEPPVFRAQTTEPIRAIRALSGESSDTPVNLDDALNIDPTLSNPAQDYQILVGTGIIQNNLITNGIRITKSYNAHKTENDDPPDQNELDEAAISMYRQAAREMFESLPYLTLDVKCHLQNKPLIHDRVWVDIDVYEQDFDLYTGQTQLVQTLSIREWLYIHEIKYDHRERPLTTNHYTGEVVPSDVYMLTLSQRQDDETYDTTEMLYRELKSFNKFDTIDSAVGIYGRSRITLQQDNVPADCNFNGPNTGREFQIAVPPAPPQATAVNAVVVGITPGYTYSNINNATIGGSVSFCVAPTPPPWTLVDNATITVEFVFT